MDGDPTEERQKPMIGFIIKSSFDPEAAGKLLPWVHRVISNTKAVIRGAHRGVSEKYLQPYLSEICYRFNRRFWQKELLDRLVKAYVSTETFTHDHLVSGKCINLKH